MQTLATQTVASTRSSRTIAISAATHLLVIAALLHHTTFHAAPIFLPGTDHGHNLVITYLPGSAPTPSPATSPKADPKIADLQAITPTLPTRTTKSITSPNPSAPASDHPDSTAGTDSLGSGDINIAILSFHPIPKPDLSTLPHGTRGDVILDVTIDTEGKISDLKMTVGLGHGIDEAVIAIVQQWIFHPATQNGKPVTSGQELHFHYERA